MFYNNGHEECEPKGHTWENECLGMYLGTSYNKHDQILECI